MLAVVALMIVAWMAVEVSPVGAQEDLPQNLIRQVGFDQNLDAQVPLNLPFTDSEGRNVTLGRYFGQKPVILLLGYYECPMLCSLVRNGLFASLKTLDFTVGDEFELVVISIDPEETPKVAELKRRASIMEYERSTSADGWNFLTGPQDSVGAMVAEFDARRKIVVEELNKLPGVSCITPKGAFYAFPNIKDTGFKAKKLASRLLEEEGVAIIGGPDFGILGEGYVRLSYANSAENIRRAIGRMAGFLERNHNANGE